MMLSGLFALGAGAPAQADDFEAMAHPTGCHYQVPTGGWGGVAECSNHNGGSYAAAVTCKDSNGKIFEAQGAWRQTGWSTAYCPGSSKAMYAGIWTSASNKS